MPKRGARWLLEQLKRPCRCGTPVAWLSNLRSGEWLMAPGAKGHRTPSGQRCLEWEAQEATERTRRICEKAGVRF